MAEDSFGQYLKSQRELRQISLEEVAAGTKIGIHLLRALEEDRWDILPAEVFVKGFIKSYSEYIGLDPEDTLLRYEAIKQKESPYEPEPEFNIPKGYSGPLGLESPIFFKILIIIVLVVLIGFGIYFFHNSSIKLDLNIFSHPKEDKISPHPSLNNTKNIIDLNDTKISIPASKELKNNTNNSTNSLIPNSKLSQPEGNLTNP